MEGNITSLRSYIDYELITVFSSNDEYRGAMISMLRKQNRSVRVAAERSRLKEKIKNLADKSINNALNNEDKREVSCQTTISIPPFDIINDEVLSSIGDVDDLSLSSDDENYRNCVIKRITRKPSDQHIHLRQDMSYIDLDDRENYNKNINNNLDNDDKDKKLSLLNRDDKFSTNFYEDVFVWECEFRQGIREYDSPIFTFCALKFRLSLLNIDNANKLLISLLNREKEAKLHVDFKIHSLLTTLTRSNDDDFHFSQNTGFHHGLKVGDIDLLTFLEFGKIKFSATLRTRIDKVTGSLIGNA